MRLDDIDFLIIGATKSATTWLQKSLQTDPQVAMPDPELHYFSRESSRGDDWYLAQFPENAANRVAGEKSNSYLESADAAKLIAAKLPGVKLVAQLRNPVERAYSDYCMMYRRGEIGRDVARYLDPDRPQNTRLISAGLYYRQLRAFYDRFPSDHILVTLFDDMRSEPAKHLAAVRDFLGLPASQAPYLRPGESEGQDDADGKPKATPGASSDEADGGPVSRHHLFSQDARAAWQGDQLRSVASERPQAACRLLCQRRRGAWPHDRAGLVGLAGGRSVSAGGRRRQRRARRSTSQRLRKTGTRRRV